LWRHNPVEAILIIASRWSRLNLNIIDTDGRTPCGRRASAGQNEGCERHLTSFSRCLDELAPAQVLLAVDEALEATKDAATAVAAASAIAAMRQQAEPAGEVARPPKGRYG
jgi:hypothetical protein